MWPERQTRRPWSTRILPVALDIAPVSQAGVTIDVSCFGLDSLDKLSDERFMVFYNQLAAPNDAIRLDASGANARFSVNLAALPASIVKLVFVAATDVPGTMRSLGASAMRLGDAVTFPLSGADFQEEKAVIVGEIYRKDEVWRFGAVGQGFSGGLSTLLALFGGTEAAPAPVEQKRVSLSKVTLENAATRFRWRSAAAAAATAVSWSA